LRMYLAGHEDYKEICEDARLEDRAHFELITPRIYELGGTIPYDIRTFADRAGCPDAYLPGSNNGQYRMDHPRDIVRNATPAQILEVLLEAERCAIRTWSEVCDITVREDEFILAAARAQGLDLPSLCEQGWCITCACWVLAGQVDQSASRRFYPQDRDAGFALICTGRPRSDLVLRPGATEALRAHRDRHHLPVPRGTRTPLSQVWAATKPPS